MCLVYILNLALVEISIILEAHIFTEDATAPSAHYIY